MSLTPGWEEADERLRAARLYDRIDMGYSERELNGQHVPLILVTEGNYWIDQGSEYKKFPRTEAGWKELCEALKTFEP